MFWCSNCPGNLCVNGSSFIPSSISLRINRQVRMPTSLYTMEKETLSVNDSSTFGLPIFNGPSDKSVRSINPITRSVGVDKKHNSYDRYLARKRGTVICCCLPRRSGNSYYEQRCIPTPY